MSVGKVNGVPSFSIVTAGNVAVSRVRDLARGLPPRLVFQLEQIARDFIAGGRDLHYVEHSLAALIDEIKAAWR